VGDGAHVAVANPSGDQGAHTHYGEHSRPGAEQAPDGDAPERAGDQRGAGAADDREDAEASRGKTGLRASLNLLRGCGSSASLPVGSPAGGDVFSVVGQQGSAEREQFAHSRAGDSVVHRAVLAPRVHEPAPSQTREMIGQVRPAEAQPQGQLADRHLAALVAQLEHPHAGRVGEHLESTSRRGRARSAAAGAGTDPR